MNFDPPLNDKQRVTIILDIAAEEGIGAGESSADAIIHDTVGALRADGYNVQPVRIVERPRRTDAGPLFEVIAFLQQFGVSVMQQKNVIDVLSELTTFFATVVPIAAHIQKSYRKHASSDKSKNHPVKITIELDGTSIEAEGPDLETAEASLQLAQRYLAKYPAAVPNTINQKSVKVKARFSKRQLRRRR